MRLSIRPFPRADWQPVPNDGCRHVESRVLLLRPDVMVTQLKFGVAGTIHEHGANWNIDVVCLEGRGRTVVDGEEARIEAGERVHWPAGKLHRLFTEDSEMLTLMVEHVGGADVRR
jgi:quercetin dioxygenase-like cupin family protein